MKRALKYVALVFAVSCVVVIGRMALDPEYKEQVQREQEAREQAEAKAKANKIAECERTRNFTQPQWESMSQLSQSTVASECRPPFAPERTAKELLNSAGRATQKATKRVGENIESTLNKPF